jgi:peptide-methionine (S)-S-oxide reductase
MQRISFFLFLLSFTLACEKAANQTADSGQQTTEEVKAYLADTNTDTLEVATFSGGHFYGLEAIYEQLRGTQIVLAGYTGGKSKGPNFERVNSGDSKHRMAVQVYFNPKKISYQMLLAVYFAAHDPTKKEQQGIEMGPQFIPAVYVHDEEQKKMAEEELTKQKKKSKYKGKTLYTEITPYTNFWVAESSHQDFAHNNTQDDYVQNVLKPYIRGVEKKYGAWMLKGRAVFPIKQDAPTPNN